VFVLNPDPYLLPCYRISPFQTRHLHLNNELEVSDTIDAYFNKRFNNRDYCYTPDGRAAINIALQQYHLQPEDVVTIFTTSGNFYISSCVTGEIEKFCKWSRKIEKHTRLIFVNHEFGYPCRELNELKKYGLPIIEDCAHSFFSVAEDNTTGNTGDFVIYSFPKMFPVQTGGLLTAKKNGLPASANMPEGEKLQYIKNVLSHYIDFEADIKQQRLANYTYLKNALNPDHFEERFPLREGVVPGVFTFRVKNQQVNLAQLKTHLYAQGIQCSVFYGEHSFFFPVHQNLVKADLDYFIAAILSF
jgi:hypothetical protein